MIDVLITGGHVVTPQQEGPLDVGIAGERIAFVAEPGTVAAEAGRTIDATGLLVLPGGVEPHAHIHEPMHHGWSQGRDEWLQPPEGATRAALFGGTTTVVSFAFMDVHVRDRELDCNLAVQHRTEVFRGRSYTDFAFHPVLTGTLGDTTRGTIGEAVADGTATFKFFTTDLTTTQTGVRFDHGSARALLDECARHGAMAMVHAEDDDLIKFMEARLRREGRTELRNVHLVHTNEGEELAVRTIAELARHAGRRALRRARLRRARARHHRGAAGGRAAGLRRGAAQQPLLLARRLREARRREVPHRHGAQAAAGLRGALARPRGRPPLDPRDGRVHHQPRGQARGPRHRDDAGRPRRHRDPGDDRRSPRASTRVG